MNDHPAGLGCRIGIDVGGTFTDFVLANGATGSFTRYKEASVPDDPSLSVERGLPALLERAGVMASDIDLIVHGTTLPLNAIIQRRGAKLGLVVSRGNRGVLEIGRGQLPNAFSFALQKEAPLVPRSLVLETSARMRSGGIVHTQPDATELAAIAESFRAASVDAVTVMLLHAYSNPDFERQVAEQLGAVLPGIPVTASATIWPEQREFERCMIALLNSYVQPIMSSYLGLLETRVMGLGVTAPIYITANNGGTLSLATARQRPIDTILSGPASGVVAAALTARLTGQSNYVTVDMGGTSADMSIIQNGEPENTTQTYVGEFPIILPVVNVSAIGAGGGSIVWVDRHGVLKIGPESAGASPGPVCYGRGTRPTVTDCYLVAGLIDADRFLGGRMKLDRDAAVRALDAIAASLGLAGDDRAVRAAEAALRVTSAVMATEMTKNVAQRGDEIRDYSLVPFGGAGPTQANFIAEDAGMTRIIVPVASSTFCALGAILADVKRDYVQSVFVSLDTAASAPTLRAALDALEAESSTWIANEGAILGNTMFEYSLDMRYAEQGYDLKVPLDTAQRGRLDLAELEELFHRAHERTYNFRDLETAIEITAVRVRVVGTVENSGLPQLATQGSKPSIAKRRFYWAESYWDAEVYERNGMGPGIRFAGPAIVEQEDSTIVVLDGWNGTVDSIGNLILERVSSAQSEHA